MMDRRTFIKTSAIAGGALLLNPVKSFSKNYNNADFFGIHPFIEENPDAVFIMRTDVDVKTNSVAKKQAGLNFGESVFVPLSSGEGGFSVANNVAIKPNLTDRPLGETPEEKERFMGIVTDVDFVEGVIESIKLLGVPGNNCHLREVNGVDKFDDAGYDEMVQRTGANLFSNSTNVNNLSENEVVWLDVNDGVWFRKIPYLWPMNAEDTFYLNISKLKAHGMGLTLCAKNIQGTIASPYQQHCRGYYSGMSIKSAHKNPNASDDIWANFTNHRKVIPRWDSESYDHTSGLGMETWVSRCLDNNSVSKVNLHIIEGIYGRDGDFTRGPAADNLATDYMMNYIIFGKNAFHVDNIGHWLGAHEPGNFGLFHIAIERGLASILNPNDIPLYEWNPNGSATLTPLENFARTPLKTYYLHQSGQEDYWHLCDEPFEYPGSSVKSNNVHKPESIVLHNNYPNPFNPVTSIKFNIPKNGIARIEICNIKGEIVDVLTDRFYNKGTHLVQWNASRFPSGNYFYRLQFDGFSEVKNLCLIK